MRSLPMLKVLVLVPGVVVSTLLTCMVGALLPPLAGLLVFVAGLTVALVLATGRLEAAGLRLMYQARPLQEWEAAALAPTVSLLCSQGIGPPAVTLYVRESEGMATWSAGRQSVIVSSGLVRTLHQRQLTVEEAAGLLAHAVGRLHIVRPRFDLAVEFWTLPWQILRGICTAIGHAFAWLPLVEFAWKIRFVVATIAVVQSVVDGRAPAGVVIAVFVGLTYLTPGWRRAWEVRVEAAADQFVCDHALSGGLAAYLGRGPAAPAVLARIHRMSGPTQRPTLAVVR